MCCSYFLSNLGNKTYLDLVLLFVIVKCFTGFRLVVWCYSHFYHVHHVPSVTTFVIRPIYGRHVGVTTMRVLRFSSSSEDESFLPSIDFSNLLHWGKDLTLVSVAQLKFVNIITLLLKCLGVYGPCCCAEGGVVLTISMCLCVGVQRNKQLCLHSCVPLCPSTALTGDRDAP